MTVEEVMVHRVEELLSQLPASRWSAASEPFQYSIRCNDQISVTLKVSPGDERLCLDRDLGTLSADAAEFLVDTLLRYNFLWQLNHGLHFALEGERVLLRIRVPLDHCTAGEMPVLLVNFAQMGEYWRELLETGPRHSQDPAPQAGPQDHTPGVPLASFMAGLKA